MSGVPRKIYVYIFAHINNIQRSKVLKQFGNIKCMARSMLNKYFKCTDNIMNTIANV